MDEQLPSVSQSGVANLPNRSTPTLPSLGFGAGVVQGLEQFSETTIGRAERYLQAQRGSEVTAQQFEGSAWQGLGLKWRPGITTGELTAALEAQRRAQERQQFTERATAMGMVGEFAGGLAASVADPINLLPIGALNLTRGVVANAIRLGAVNAGIEAATGVPAEYYLQNYVEQQSYTAADALASVVMAGVLGGALGGGGVAVNRLLNMNRALQLPTDSSPAPSQPLSQSPADAQATLSAAPQQPAPTALADAARAQGLGVPEAAAPLTQTAPAPGTIANAADPNAPIERDGIRFPNRDAAEAYFYDPNVPSSREWAAGVGLKSVDEAREVSALYRQAVNNNRGSSPTTELNVAPTLAAVADPTFSKPPSARPDQRQNIEMELKLRGVPDSDKLTAAQKQQKQTALREIQARDAQSQHSTEFIDRAPQDEPPSPVFDVDVRTGEITETRVTDWWGNQVRANREGASGSNLRSDATANLLNNLRILEPEQFHYLLQRHLDDGWLSALSDATGLSGDGRVEWITNITESLFPNRAEAPPQARASAMVEDMQRVGRETRAREAAQAILRGEPNQAQAHLQGIGEVRSEADILQALEGKFGRDTMLAFQKELAGDVQTIQRTRQATLEAAICLIGG